MQILLASSGCQDSNGMDFNLLRQQTAEIAAEDEIVKNLGGHIHGSHYHPN